MNFEREPQNLAKTPISVVVGLLSTRPQSRQRVVGFNFTTLRPIMVGMTLKTSGLGVIRPRSVARLAVFNPWHENIAHLFAGERRSMTSQA